jgi:phosphatidylglycerophosphate synthase
VATSGRDWIEAGALYPWKAAVVFAATMTIAAGYVREHPFSRLGPANRVTMIRLMLLALVAGLIGEPVGVRVAATGVGLTAICAALDGLDGWLARRSGMASAFGARFDMETDALLILVLSVLVWQHEKAGAWVLVGGLLRYGFVAAGWVLPWMAGPLTPTYRAKAAAVGHMAGLAVALAPQVAPPASAVAAGVSLLALTLSFAIDVGRLWRQR